MEYRNTRSQLRDAVEDTEFATLCYNNHCSFDFDGYDISVKNNGLAMSPIVVGTYEEDDDGFWFNCTIQFRRYVAEDDGFGEFGYLARAIKDLTDIATYLNRHTFRFMDDFE